MTDCCGGKQVLPAAAGAGAAPTPIVLLYACSGGANVAEVADRACRELMFAGAGTMFCLAGLGAGIAEMVAKARTADVSLVIDGCPVDCARKVFEQAGIAGARFLRVTDLGIDKQKGVRCTQAQVEEVAGRARALLGDAPGAGLGVRQA